MEVLSEVCVKSHRPHPSHFGELVTKPHFETGPLRSVFGVVTETQSQKRGQWKEICVHWTLIFFTFPGLRAMWMVVESVVI